MRTTEFVKAYFISLGFEEKEFEIKESQDSLGYLISVVLKKDNPRIGIIIGKRGRNLRILKQLIRVIGFNERITPFLVLRLE